MNKNVLYIFTSTTVLLVLSFLLTQFNSEEKEFYFLIDSFSFSSSQDKGLYILFAFLNLF